jgi:thiol-disulfide isomerase/thioredoxin
MVLSYLIPIAFGILAYSYYNSIVRMPKGPAFIMFYSPNCGHCHAAMPEWRRMGQRVTTDKGKNVEITAINVLEHEDIARKAGIFSYPTFMYVDNGVVQKYEGDRTKQSFMTFLNSMPTDF